MPRTRANLRAMEREGEGVTGPAGDRAGQDEPAPREDPGACSAEPDCHGRVESELAPAAGSERAGLIRCEP